MITKLTSKKEVLIDTFDKIYAKPICELITFTKVKDKYVSQGAYYYIVGEGETEEKKLIRPFSKEASNTEIDALFNSLSLTYPEGATYSEIDDINMKAGLMATVVFEARWDLGEEDWE